MLDVITCRRDVVHAITPNILFILSNPTNPDSKKSMLHHNFLRDITLWTLQLNEIRPVCKGL
jgi:hypothetical protein